MKKRLFCIIASAMLLVGCGEATESSETPEYTTSSTTAATTTTAASTEEPVAEPQDGSTVGGVSLSNEHEQLRDTFRGADSYCSYEDMGLWLTHCSDIEENAWTMLEKCGELDSSFENRRFAKVLGADDGCFYFSLKATGDKVQDEAFVTWRTFYLCCDCDTGEISQIFPPAGYDSIIGISKDIVVAGGDRGYAAVHRISGYTEELPETAVDIVVAGNTVFFQSAAYESESSGARPLFTTRWYTFGDDYALKSGTSMFDQYALFLEYPDGGCEYFLDNYLHRGVNNIVCYSEEYRSLCSLAGNSYLTADPRRRVRDMVYDTYYAGSLMMEKNLLGYRTRFSLIDDSGEDCLLGIMQTAHDAAYSADFNATKDGVIYLRAAGETFVMLCELSPSGYVDSEKDIAVAFAPEELSVGFSDILCDKERLYFFGGLNGSDLLSLSRAE